MKAVFAHLAHAASFLAHVLPAPVAARVDWPSLSLVPGSFVDRELRESHTDLLFSARLHTGREARLFVLFEHFSRSHRDTSLRMSRYLVRILERFAAEHPRAPLPVVIPVVLHHNRTRFSAPRSLEARCRLPPKLLRALGPHVLRLRLVVHDLAAVSDEALFDSALSAAVRLTSWALKHSRPDTLFEASDALANLLHAVMSSPSGAEAVAAVMQYIARVSGRSSAEVHTHFATMLTEAEAQVAMNEYQRREAEMIAEALEQGEARGMKKGLERGELRAKAESVLAVFEARGLRVSAAVARQVHACEDVATLDAWLRRACLVAKASDVFA